MLYRLGFILLLFGCARVIDRIEPQAKRTPPVTPTLSVPPTILAGATQLTASVTAPIAGLTYGWTLLNATLTSPSTGTSVTFTAGSAGVIIYTVTVTNEVGDTTDPASAQSQVVADLQSGYQPVLIGPPEVIVGRSGNRVELQNPIAGVDYTWSASANASLDSQSLSSATFTGAAVGVLTISIEASIAGVTGATTASAQMQVQVVDLPSPGITLFSGQPGGPGFLDGPLAAARLMPPQLYYSETQTKDWNIVADSDGTVWLADGNTCSIRRIQNGVVATVGEPFDCRQLDTAAASDGIARFTYPTQMATDGAGGIWVADDNELGQYVSFAFALRHVDAQLNVTSYGNAISLDGTLPDYCATPGDLQTVPADNAQETVDLADATFCSGPSGVATTSAGDLFVAAQLSPQSVPSLRRFASSGAAATNEWQFFFNPSVPPSDCLATANQADAAPEFGFTQLTSDGSSIYWLGKANAQILQYDPISTSVQAWPSNATCAHSLTLAIDPLNAAILASGFVVTPGGSLFAVSPIGNDVLAWDASVLAANDFSAGQPAYRVLAGDPDPLDGQILQGLGYHDGSGANAAFRLYTNLDNTVSKPIALVYPANGTEPTQMDVADSGNGAIRQITPLATTGTVSTILGSALNGGYEEGSTANARFNAPSAVAQSFDDTLYVADSGNGAMRRIDVLGNVTTVFGGQSRAVRDGPSTIASLNQVAAMAVMPDHTLLFSDGPAIRRYDPSSGDVATVVGSTVAGFADGPSSEAALQTVLGIAPAPDGTVAIADAGNNAVRLLTTTGEVVTLAPTVVSGLPPAGSTDKGFQSTFNDPRGVAVGADGVIFVADTMNGVIRSLAISASGLSVTTVAGNPFVIGITDAPVATGSACTDTARFRSPIAIAVRPSGDLVVLDAWACVGQTCTESSYHGPTLRVVHNPESPADCFVTTAAGRADSRFQGFLAGALPGAFNTPSGLSLGVAQNFWLTDTTENTVLSVELPP